MESHYDTPFAYSDTKTILSLHQPPAEDNATGRRVIVESLTSPLARTAHPRLLDSQPIDHFDSRVATCAPGD